MPKSFQITRIHPDCLRIQIAPENGAVADSALNRYGFIHEAAVREGGPERLRIVSSASCEEALEAVDGDNKILFRLGHCRFFKEGALAEFDLFDPEEDWIGFGDQTRERLFHRGHSADCVVSNVASYIPVPMFLSTRGYGILVNTTHRVRFDMGAENADRFQWFDRRGLIDFYVWRGADFKALLDFYTRLTGRPELPPLWSFGLWYICRTQADDTEVMSDAAHFRELGIPCDVIGLEPGWMEVDYDCSIHKKWSSARFPLPDWQKGCNFTFIKALKRMGYKLELWLCNDYDLSFEEERRIGAGEDSAKPAETPPAFCRNAELDDHFMEPIRLDKITVPEEPWFRHLEQFVDWGADFFKQDGAFQVCAHPDRLYSGNGMTDHEMHNLYPLLYARQMNEGFARYANGRPLVFTVAGWTGFQHYCGTWTGDTGGRLETLGAMLNTACTGHSWCTNDMEVAQPEGIHFGYLLPWSQINSWTYFRMPWLQGDKLLEMHRFYARLRSRLIPYLYSYARLAAQTGVPLMLPLPLEFESDHACRKVLHEYLLGRDMLVAIYRREAYFPRGEWRDFWSGEVIRSQGETRKIDWPEDRGGGLFLRSGALIPLGLVMNYRGERTVDEIELLVYPGDAADSRMELYEDDGVSFDYRDGKFTVTAIHLSRTESGWRLEIAPDVRAPERKWSLLVALETPPETIRNNGRELKDGVYDSIRGELRLDAVHPGIVEFVMAK